MTAERLQHHRDKLSQLKDESTTLMKTADKDNLPNEAGELMGSWASAVEEMGKDFDEKTLKSLLENDNDFVQAMEVSEDLYEFVYGH